MDALRYAIAGLTTATSTFEVRVLGNDDDDDDFAQLELAYQRRTQWFKYGPTLDLED